MRTPSRANSLSPALNVASALPVTPSQHVSPVLRWWRERPCLRIGYPPSRARRRRTAKADAVIHHPKTPPPFPTDGNPDHVERSQFGGGRTQPFFAISLFLTCCRLASFMRSFVMNPLGSFRKKYLLATHHPGNLSPQALCARPLWPQRLPDSGVTPSPCFVPFVSLDFHYALSYITLRLHVKSNFMVAPPPAVLSATARRAKAEASCPPTGPP